MKRYGGGGGGRGIVSEYKMRIFSVLVPIVQELCESRGGRPGLSVLTSLMISLDVKQYILNHAHALVSSCP